MLPFSSFALFCYTYLSVCYMRPSLLWVFSGCGPYFKMVIKISIIIFMTDIKQLYFDTVFSHIAQPYF